MRSSSRRTRRLRQTLIKVAIWVFLVVFAFSVAGGIALVAVHR
ncbi:MAG: hypothetical protein ACREM8_00910 [Vulcanimicrobiaceae bacterium]